MEHAKWGGAEIFLAFLPHQSVCWGLSTANTVVPLRKRQWIRETATTFFQNDWWFWGLIGHTLKLSHFQEALKPYSLKLGPSQSTEGKTHCVRKAPSEGHENPHPR